LRHVTGEAEGVFLSASCPRAFDNKVSFKLTRSTLTIGSSGNVRLQASQRNNSRAEKKKMRLLRRSSHKKSQRSNRKTKGGKREKSKPWRKAERLGLSGGKTKEKRQQSRLFLESGKKCSKERTPNQGRDGEGGGDLCSKQDPQEKTGSRN